MDAGTGVLNTQSPLSVVSLIIIWFARVIKMSLVQVHTLSTERKLQGESSVT